MRAKKRAKAGVKEARAASGGRSQRSSTSFPAVSFLDVLAETFLGRHLSPFFKTLSQRLQCVRPWRGMPRRCAFAIQTSRLSDLLVPFFSCHEVCFCSSFSFSAVYSTHSSFSVLFDEVSCICLRFLLSTSFASFFFLMFSFFFFFSSLSLPHPHFSSSSFSSVMLSFIYYIFVYYLLRLSYFPRRRHLLPLLFLFVFLFFLFLFGSFFFTHMATFPFHLLSNYLCAHLRRHHHHPF